MYKFIICVLFFNSLKFSTIIADHQHYVEPKTMRAPMKTFITDEESTEYWNSKAQNWLSEKLNAYSSSETKLPSAKNVILFLGDGMSVHTITAARSLLGDSSEKLTFEKFPHSGLSRTYCVDKQVADSACTSTAYLGGVKANYGTIGVNAKVLRGNCETGIKSENFVESIAKWALDAQKSAGLVTTARVTHASPAGVYAHTADRNWESNANVRSSGCDDQIVPDIAEQLIEGEVGSKLSVIMGGGRQNFRSNEVNDEEGYPNSRTDGRDLINEWLQNKTDSNAHYVWSRKGLSLVDLSKTDYLLGLFSNSHCPYSGDLKRKHTSGVYPTLTEMTEAAIKVLQRNNHGFFLFVEGARIDMAHHDAKVQKSLEDTVEFSNAVQRALDLTSKEDTLIVVTSDHAHTMMINGYPTRGTDITSTRIANFNTGNPETVLSYGNGPGYKKVSAQVTTKFDKSDVEALMQSADYAYPGTVPLDSETHGGDDVGIFAHGPFAQYFSGNYEQTHIPALMARAANIGPFANIH